MTPAYSHMYLADAKSCLSSAFDYAVYDCRVPSDTFASIFACSDLARQFECGNPAIVAGLSGFDLACEVLAPCGLLDEEPEPRYRRELSSEYWAGEVLAGYQWSRRCHFADIFARVPFSQVAGLYHPLHEADASVFDEQLDLLLVESAPTQTNLARLRSRRHLSQRELARTAGVGLKSIQAYEQRVNSLNRASGETLRRLSATLGCPIESLLEFEPQVTVEYLAQGGQEGGTAAGQKEAFPLYRRLGQS